MPRAYCRICDAAVDADGAWPGRCTACKAPIEAHPVEDVIAPGLRALFVGINPGVQTARHRVHFANPQNTFWSLLRESGLAPQDAHPARVHELPAHGVGITNVVTRATPGSADVRQEDIMRGRARLESLVREMRPRWLVFVGKQAWTMATGQARPTLGVQSQEVFGSRAFVLPSTSPANAAVSREQKLRWFIALHEVA